MQLTSTNVIDSNELPMPLVVLSTVLIARKGGIHRPHGTPCKSLNVHPT